VVITGIVAAGLLYASANKAAKILAAVILFFSAIGALVLLLMWLYDRKEKFRLRNKMLDMLTWRGDEQVLDIGTGHGLLLIGAAKRLTTGLGVGVDVWSTNKPANNIPRAVLTNAKLEEVKERVKVLEANAQDLPLANSHFDYVLSNLCLHCIKTKEGRSKACQEIVRVLKPGGTALIADARHTLEYEAEFINQGMETTRTLVLLAAPMVLHIVKAVKQE
jgi:ubiquinone/menaquinone biosynthesis C-methylase UbiE